MGILSEFERRLEGAIEGLFSKAFRGGVQPVELARRILKEMDAGRTVGVKEVWVPNRFVFHLAPEDRDRLALTEGALRRELEQVVVDGARERGWSLVGPTEVRFETADDLSEGRFACEASLVEGPLRERLPRQPEAEPAVEPEERQATPEAPPTPARFVDGPAEIILIVDGIPGKAHALDRDRVSIGRIPGSDIMLPDPGASRQHAEIRREDGHYVITDLGSTNGTMVNESRITERELADGDRITIGRTVLEFRRR